MPSLGSCVNRSSIRCISKQSAFQIDKLCWFIDGEIAVIK